MNYSISNILMAYLDVHLFTIQITQPLNYVFILTLQQSTV